MDDSSSQGTNHLQIILHPNAYPVPLTVHPARLCDLPLELIFLVGTHFQTSDQLCSAQMTCRFLRYVYKDDRLWKRLCQKNFSTPEQFVAAMGLTWKEAYRMHIKVLREMVYSSCGGSSSGGMLREPIILRAF